MQETEKAKAKEFLKKIETKEEEKSTKPAEEAKEK
jgi:hypothetical protein